MNYWRGVVRAGMFAACVAAVGGVSGCWLAAAYERSQGKAVDAVYRGIDNKSVAVVVWTQQGVDFEYPQARKEISAFVAKYFHQNMATVRLLDYREVLRWQDDTLNWQNLMEKDWGKHFGVDRVVSIDLLRYDTREPGALDFLHGRLVATAKVFEVDAPGATASWQQDFDVSWPDTEPLGPGQGDETTVRIHLLDSFGSKLVNCFYDHRELDPTIREKAP